MNETPSIDLLGARVFRGFLDRAAQEKMVMRLRDAVVDTPFIAPETPGGRKMSVRQTSAGELGWATDRSGYRYAEVHPNGVAWPQIPEQILDIWRAVAGADRLPNSSLINFYGEGARMGMHQDRDEKDYNYPVVSISLGDAAQFRIGGTERGGPTKSIWLESGDVVVLGGAARLAYHGVDKIRFQSSTLLPKGGRINVTLRVVLPG